MKKLVFLLIALVAFSAPAFAAEWLTNGDFQTGTAYTAPAVQPVDGWTYWTAVSNTGSDGTGLGSNHMTAVGSISEGSAGVNYTMPQLNATHFYYQSARGGNTSGGYNGIYQEKLLIPGTYTLTGTVATLNMRIVPGGQEWYAWEVGIIKGAWNTVPPVYGGSGQRIPEYGSANEYGIWGNKNVDTGGGAVALTSLPYLAGGPGTNQIVVTTAAIYTVYIEAGTNCDPGSADKRRFKLMADDMSLDRVPEPGSLLALGAGLLGLVGIIRRKR